MILKWIFDRVVSLIGLLCLCPVLIVVAILIKVKMPGPVLFVQKRVGKDGRLFNCHKFRSMTVSHGGSSISVAGESRITPLGAKLRHYKLDELPELWDVFIGNMSFVGPRPDVPGYADLLQGDDREVLKLRPGITGPATMKYRDEEDLLAVIDKALREGGEVTCATLNNQGEMTNEKVAIKSVQDYNDLVIYPDKVRINRYYLHHYSFWKDIQMIVFTVLGKKMKYNNEMI